MWHFILRNLRSSFVVNWPRRDFLSCCQTEDWARLMAWILNWIDKSALIFPLACGFNPICINCKAISHSSSRKTLIELFPNLNLVVISSRETRQDEEEDKSIRSRFSPYTCAVCWQNQTLRVKRNPVRRTHRPWRNFRALPSGISPKSRRGKSAARECNRFEYLN